MSYDGGGGGKPTDSWQPTDGDGVKVDIHGLQDFVKALGDEIRTQFEVNLKQGVEPMLRVRAPFGGGTLKEGQFFQQMHVRDLGAVGELLKEASLGLAAINSAAFAIAVDYLGSDALTSASVTDVMNAFYPPAGMQTLQGQLAAGDPDVTVTADAPITTPDLTDVPPPPEVGYIPGYTYNPDGSVVVAGGQPGQYVIPEDSDHPHDVPADPALSQ